MHDERDRPEPDASSAPIIREMLRHHQRRSELDAERLPDADRRSYVERLAAARDNPDLVGPKWVAPEQRELAWTATRATITWHAPGGGQLQHLLVDTPERCTIGRSLTQDLVVWERNVSRRHALLTAEGPDWWIEDTRSTNQTKIRRWSGQDERHITIVVEPQRREMLHHTDSVILGTALLRFEDPDESWRLSSDDFTPAMEERLPYLTAVGLTSQQSRVLNVLCQPALDGGVWASNAEIAAALGVELSTVRSHMKELYSRFMLPERGLTREQRRAELVRRAIGGGWISPLVTDESFAGARIADDPIATNTSVHTGRDTPDDA